MLTAERVREVLNYDPETGVFTWRKKTGRKAKIGKVAGGSQPHRASNRIYIGVDGHRYFAHRLAWLWMTGAFPSEEMTVDHVDGNSSDNRWANLRLASKTQNQGNRRTNRNSGSGMKGVEWHPQSGKWRAKIRHAGKGRHLGLFASKEDAGRAYMAAAERKFGEFATSGERSSPRPVK